MDFIASAKHLKIELSPKKFICRNLSVKICIGQSNKVKTSDKQTHVRFCDNSFYCKISSDKLERRSDTLIRVRSIDLTRNGLSLRPALKSRINEDYFLFISYGIESTCICLSYVFSPSCHFDWTVKSCQSVFLSGLYSPITFHSTGRSNL